MRFCSIGENEYLQLLENNSKILFTGPYRLGKPPIIRTEYPISTNSTGKFTLRASIVNGGKDNAIAVGFTVKRLEVDEQSNENFYMYKYHGRNGYIYGQCETPKHFTEKIIKSQAYTTSDVIEACVNFATNKVGFKKNGKKVGELFVSKKAVLQRLYPFISLNTPDAVVQSTFYADGKNTSYIIFKESRNNILIN